MTYSIKEIFYTLQGEGINAGRAAVFCRFGDTDFVGTDGTLGGKYASAAALAERIGSCWSPAGGRRLVVLTGGEPLLQVDAALIEALHARGFEIAVETNGSLEAPPGLDWICVSPKAGVPLKLRGGSELKVVVPQPGLDLGALASLAFEHFLLQPMDGPLASQNTQHAIEMCLADPRWRLSVQTHKTIGIR